MAQQSSSASRWLIIQDVTIVSPERPVPLDHADVLIHGTRIAQIGRRLQPPAGAHRISGSGRFLIPGLIDSHVHVGHSAALTDEEIDRHPELWAAYKAQVPRAFLAFGFTTVVDLDLPAGVKSWFEGTPLHPNFYSCGPGVKVAGGYLAQHVPADPKSPHFPNLVYEPAEKKYWPSTLNPDDFAPEKAVWRALAQGAICLKVFDEPGYGIFNWPVPHAATLRALRQSAKRHGLVMMVHATGVSAWQTALAAHADVIAHGLWVWPGSPADPNPPAVANEVIAAAARQGVRVQPTMQVTLGERSMIDPAILKDPRLAYSLPPQLIAFLGSAEARSDAAELLNEYRSATPAPYKFEDLLETVFKRVRATFRLMLQDKVRLILGTDTPAGDGIGNPPGLNGRIEIQNWADAGATPRQILRAATIENARALGLEHSLGTVEAGKQANLLLLKRNPLRGVDAYDTIETVILNGQPIERDTLKPVD
ncbi:MAG TPA: amidohydrolase family protein [Sphingomicrobium sp.]|nr:amidohydrolase family protein [Sphingomicrobium sp.]